MQTVIANKKASFSYTADVPYSHSFKQLESIGRDIIDQTDPSIEGSNSAKMSTAMLRVKLYSLDKALADLSVDHPCIFEDYIQMLRIINSIPRNKMVWVINLIALLSFQSWENVPPQQQKSYIDALGEDFICAFNSNELVTILLQSDSAEVILTGSYLYSLLKMLFIVFGYSKLVPIVTDTCSNNEREAYREKLRKHFEKYRGAFFRRGDDREVEYVEKPCKHCPDSCRTAPCSKPYIKPCDDNGSICQNNNSIPETLEQVETVRPRNEMHLGESSNCIPDCEPVNPCIYDVIKLFGDLYPTLIGLMGGTEVFPPECIEVSCNDIPPNYDCLSSLPEYLWRFNDFSYCRHLEYVNSRMVRNALSAKVNAKARYLQTM